MKKVIQVATTDSRSKSPTIVPQTSKIWNWEAPAVSMTKKTKIKLEIGNDPREESPLMPRMFDLVVLIPTDKTNSSV